MSVRKEAKAEEQKLKNMLWKDRAQYAWGYYKFHILALIPTTGAPWTMGIVIYRQTFTTQLSIAVINDRAGTTSSAAGLETGLKEALRCGSKDLIESNEGLSASFSEDSMFQYDYATLAKIPALVASRSLDVVIGDRASTDRCAPINVYQNLEEYLPPGLYYRMRDHIYRTSDEQGSLQPFAISLEDIAFAQETGVLMNPPYLTVISSAPHEKATLVMVRYLFP